MKLPWDVMSSRQGRNEIRWCLGQEGIVWRPHVRAWNLSEANVLYWRKYLWHWLDFSSPPAVIRRPHSDSAPGELCSHCPLVSPLLPERVEEYSYKRLICLWNSFDTMDFNKNFAKLNSIRALELKLRDINTFHSGVRDTRTFIPTLAYRCASILVLAIPCQQLRPGARTPACTMGCQRLPPANVNSRLAERDARGCSKSQITNTTFIIGIHSRSGQ